MNAAAAPSIRWRLGARAGRWLGTVLVAALLAVQWAGVQHQILHGVFAAIQAEREGGDADPAKWQHHDGHSCVLFDAAALCHGPPALVIATVPRSPARFSLVVRSFASPPDLPLPRRFMTRAPPSVHA